jgi:hypothetical protein
MYTTRLNISVVDWLLKSILQEEMIRVWNIWKKLCPITLKNGRNIQRKLRIPLVSWVKRLMKRWFLRAHQPQYASAICYWNVISNSFWPENFPLTTLKEFLALFNQWEGGIINLTSLLPLSQSKKFYARTFVTVQFIATSQLKSTRRQRLIY